MRWLLLCLVIAGCARAGKENSIIGGLFDAGPRDGTDVPPPDGSLIDAPPKMDPGSGGVEKMAAGRAAP